MCCGRLHRLTKERFRQPRPLRANPPNPPPPGTRNPVVRPNAEGKVCLVCGAGLRMLSSCCRTILRCMNYPRCKYRETYDKQGNQI